MAINQVMLDNISYSGRKSNNVPHWSKNPVIEAIKNASNKAKNTPKTPAPAPSYGGGGGGGYVGGSVASSAPSAPKMMTYDDLSAEKKKLYDQFNYYTPDWKKLDSAHQGVLDSFQGQRDAFQAQTDAGKADLLTQYNRLLGDASDGRQASARQFADARRDIQEREFLADRQNRAVASASGVSDSGASQLSSLQNRMVSGDAMSQVADGFYEKEKAIQKEMVKAQDNYNSATVQLDNTLKSALADIMSAEKQTDAQYKQSIEQAKRQVQLDSNAVQKAKQDFLATEHQMNMQLKQFERSAFESDRAFNLSVQQMNQAQANANRSFQAQQDALNRQMQGAGEMSAEQQAQLAYQFAMEGGDIEMAYKHLGNLNPGAQKFFSDYTQYYGPSIADSTSKKKKSSNKYTTTNPYSPGKNFDPNDLMSIKYNY